MFFWSCLTAALVGWLAIGGIVVAVLYVPHWVVALLAVVVALHLIRPERNVRGRRR